MKPIRVPELFCQNKNDNMKKLSELKKENFIAMSKLIDNNFIGNAKIVVEPMKMGIVKVIGHTKGKQCINCDVKFDIYMNKLNGVFIYNSDIEVEGPYRQVYPPTLKKVIDYLKENDFDFCPATNNRVVA